MTEAVAEPREFSNVTPSGVEVFYSPAPKRHYKVRKQLLLATDADQPEWVEVPSVTTILGVLDKPALSWWGMKVGIEGVLELHRRGALTHGTVNGHEVIAARDDVGAWVVAGAEHIVSELTANKLTVNHVRDKAGDRGTAVHDAFELWADDGKLPDPSMFPDEQRGYVEGLVAFLKDVNPEPVGAEVMVGSVKHGFAGRYDVRLQIKKECQVVFHRTPVKGPQYATLKPGVILGDLKTSAGVYVSHHLQLAAYEGASVECGYEKTSAQGILHVSKEGNYEFVRSHGTLKHFLAIKSAYDALKAIKDAK